MPLSDLFKKSPKRQTTDSAGGDPALFSPELQKKRYDAALDFLRKFQERMPLVRGQPHPGTSLAVAARLAGTSLYRSLYPDQNLTPGVGVLSEEVNQAWPDLMRLFAFYCHQNGIDVLSKPTVTEFPAQDKPLMGVEDVLREYQDQFHEIMKKHGLDYLNGARAGVVIASMIFQYHCVNSRDIDPFVAAGIVAMGIVEGAKIAPPALGTKPTNPGTYPVGNKRYGDKDRVVFGERDFAIQEALDHGGTFIDPGDEVLRILHQKGVDPYLIYEEALRQQIRARIPRIDFAQADVDALYDEWKSKSTPDAPIHVRLILWLKNNAIAHGYEQSGNSWILKK